MHVFGIQQNTKGKKGRGEKCTLEGSITPLCLKREVGRGLDDVMIPTVNPAEPSSA